MHNYGLLYTTGYFQRISIFEEHALNKTFQNYIMFPQSIWISLRSHLVFGAAGILRKYCTLDIQLLSCPIVY